MNGEDQALTFIYLVGFLLLVASAFFVRRVPIGQGVKMLAGWILIFSALFVAFTLKDDFKSLGRRVMQELTGESQVVQAGETLRIKKSVDGHFWVTARLNREDVRFLVDSGATTTSISANTARRAGIEPSGSFPVLIQTANGTVTAERGRAETIRVGSIERNDLPVHISASFGNTDVLGMNFLSSLSGWGVEGEWLILKP